MTPDYYLLDELLTDEARRVLDREVSTAARRAPTPAESAEAAVPRGTERGRRKSS